MVPAAPSVMEDGAVLEANEAAAAIEEVRAWAAGLEALHARIAGRFVRERTTTSQAIKAALEL